MKKLLMNRLGFSLVELMVVVAIIGILSAVAIPSFKKFQAKAKTSEAKIQLAAMYSAELSFNTDTDYFAACLSNMGYEPFPDGSPDLNYYTVGFQTGQDGINASVSDMGFECDVDGAGTTFWIGSKGGNSAVRTDLESVTPDQTAFQVSAAGNIQSKTGAKIDVWSMNQNKKLFHKKTGY